MKYRNIILVLCCALVLSSCAQPAVEAATVSTENDQVVETATQVVAAECGRDSTGHGLFRRQRQNPLFKSGTYVAGATGGFQGR